MTVEQQPHPPASDATRSDDAPRLPAGRTLSVMAGPSALRTWVWFLLKNVIGWVLILAAFVAGPLVPGPGGIPLFLIGFSLITFPGKRRLTAGVLYGRQIPPHSRAYRITAALLAVLLPVAMVFVFRWRHLIPSSPRSSYGMLVGVTYAATALLLWYLILKARPLVNRLLRWMPPMRRKVRPWLRRRGIDLLPRRRRRRHRDLDNGHSTEPDEEILEIHERHRTRLSSFWTFLRPWLQRLAVLAITAAIFAYILKPVVARWDLVRERVWATSWAHFGAGAAMFAFFLFAFRAMEWRYILGVFVRRRWLPVPAAVRIWSTSELARYLPGAIWQVVGRVYLVKPYGVRGSVCSASQMLELTIFLLANVIVAVACMCYLGVRNLSGPAERWVYAAMALVPVLSFLLHPRILYGIINRVLARLGKPSIPGRMRFEELFGRLAWSVIGLLFQGVIIWFVVSKPLGGLPLVKWWVVAGPYCLAWVAGFLAFWAQGGLGVRELVFVAAMEVALPPQTRALFPDPLVRAGVLAFLSVLLRLWATAGEIILAGIAYVADYRGAMGDPNAPGRVPAEPAGVAVGSEGEE
jgi:hypothetical protein